MDLVWPWVIRACRRTRLPTTLGREELGDEIRVVGSERLGVGLGVALGGEVVGVKGLHVLQMLAVLVVQEMGVCALAMPRVEAVVAQPVAGSPRQVILADTVNIFVVAPKGSPH